MKYLLTLLWSLGAIAAQAQEYTGHVADKEDGAPVAGAIVTARDSLGKPLGYTTTSASGDFVLRPRGDGTTAQLDFSTMGYRRQSVPANAGRMLVLLTPETTDIREVTIRAPRLSFRGDTVSYNVSRFTEAQDRSIADVLRKMPGIEVAKSGEIRYNGQPINNFYIEGLDMLDGRYGQATNNIAPQDVASVEVMENHQPIKALKDIVFSDRAAINLRLKPHAKARWTGTLRGGAGLVAGVVERRALRHAHRCPGAVDGQPQNRQHGAKPLGRDRTAFGRGHPQRRGQRLQSRRTPFGRHFVRAARRYTHALQPLAHGRAEQPAQTLRGLPAQQLAHLGLRPPGLGSRRPAKLVPGGRHARGHRAGVGRFVPATAFGTHRTESQHRAVLYAGKTRSFAGMERPPCRALGQLPQPPACRGPGLRHRKRPEIYPAHRHTFAHRHLLPEIPYPPPVARCGARNGQPAADDRRPRFLHEPQRGIRHTGRAVRLRLQRRSFGTLPGARNRPDGHRARDRHRERPFGRLRRHLPPAGHHLPLAAAAADARPAGRLPPLWAARQDRRQSNPRRAFSPGSPASR